MTQPDWIDFTIRVDKLRPNSPNKTVTRVECVAKDSDGNTVNMPFVDETAVVMVSLLLDGLVHAYMTGNIKRSQ